MNYLSKVKEWWDLRREFSDERIDKIINEWKRKSETVEKEVPIFIGENHTDAYIGKFTEKLIKRLYKVEDGKSIGLYLEALPSYCKSTRSDFWENVKKQKKSRYSPVYQWNPEKYDGLIKNVEKYCKIYGIDNNEAKQKKRVDKWTKLLKKNKEEILIVLCGCFHVDFYDDLIKKLGHTEKNSFLITSKKVDRIQDLKGSKPVLLKSFEDLVEIGYYIPGKKMYDWILLERKSE
jgi:hypothetical protein